jgi:hemerythrin
MAIEWNDELATGSIEIDLQHRELFERFGKFSAAFDQGTETRSLLELLTFLEEYARTHFAYEEEIQERYSYPGLAGQVKSHELFMQDIKALRKKIESAGPTHELATNLKGKMIRYLIQHLRNDDRKLGDFLRGKTP